MLTPDPWAMLTASPTSSSRAAAATIPAAVSSTQVKSRVWVPSPKITGRSPALIRETNFGITSALVPSACSRGP